VRGVSYFRLSQDGSTLVYRAGSRLRAVRAGDKPDEKSDDKPGRKSGWIDLNRIKISVNPVQEWNQMLREAWRLMRDHFWVEEMSGVDWGLIFKRYQVLIDKVGSRLEFSDLVWEMQGELGTSHAYEMGGDYRVPPAYAMGQLVADFSHDEKNDRFSFNHIVRGDSWEEGASSPLTAPGVNVKEGDVLLAIGGQEVGKGVTPGQLLVNQAGNNVELLVGDSKGRNPRKVVVKALSDEHPARYREWIESNRALVHDRTDNRVGYVHIPDMGPRGYSEFHRYYKTEIQGEGLIVDFRFNSGGHVSELILEKLLRKRIGYVLTRWGQPEPYPRESVLGPMVAITNELSGSDGDIASHCFKLLGLGPLVGKRTWGGVIGISPSHRLADGSLTTQPEFSFWFRDVGFGVENYGTDPDYDVD
ncbi:MAG: S41 family peptidase, partial [Acidimicrobiia bacterium]